MVIVFPLQIIYLCVLYKAIEKHWEGSQRCTSNASLPGDMLRSFPGPSIQFRQVLPATHHWFTISTIDWVN